MWFKWKNHSSLTVLVCFNGICSRGRGHTCTTLMGVIFSFFWTKPPNAKSRSSANKPNVFATVMFLPADPINLNNADADWLTSTSNSFAAVTFQNWDQIQLHSK